MAPLILAYLLGLFAMSPANSQGKGDILEIGERLNEWQPIIDKELKDNKKLFKYSWGAYYQYDKWFNEQLDHDTLTLSKVVSVIKKEKLGTFLYRQNHSFAGDWVMVIYYYYDLNDKLYYIWWRMSTFQAEEPATVEKRLYFDENGNLIQKLQSVYKMNTEEKIDTRFEDRDVDYKLDWKEMDFFKYWKE